tara:strand:- start:362 stop:553 length:192 start_codon:yes stop_codon:yes gene_type:complete
MNTDKKIDTLKIKSHIKAGDGLISDSVKSLGDDITAAYANFSDIAEKSYNYRAIYFPQITIGK